MAPDSATPAIVTGAAHEAHPMTTAIRAVQRRIVELGTAFSYYPATYPDGSPWAMSNSGSEGAVGTRHLLAAAELLSGIDGVRIASVRPGNQDVWHLYVIRVEARDRVVTGLAAAGIGAVIALELGRSGGAVVVADLSGVRFDGTAVHLASDTVLRG